jgi:hypothetical protein
VSVTRAGFDSLNEIRVPTGVRVMCGCRDPSRHREGDTFRPETVGGGPSTVIRTVAGAELEVPSLPMNVN